MLIILLTFILTLGVCLSLSACGQRENTTEASEESGVASETEASELSNDEIFALADRLIREGHTVFWWYHSDLSDELGIDLEADTVEIDGQEFQKVGIFQTMNELKAATEAVFTSEFCETHFYDKINNYEKFKEVDGILYHNEFTGGMGWIFSLPKEYVVQSAGDDKIVLTAICDGLDWMKSSDDPVEYKFELVLLNDDSGWKLDTYYSYTSDGYLGNLLLREVKPDLDDLEDLTQRYLYPILFSGATQLTWTDPEQIDAGRLIDMYGYVMVWNNDISESAMVFENDIPYYYVSAGILEPHIFMYFDVSADHLHTAAQYAPDKNKYAFNMSGVGFAYDPHVLRAEYDGANLLLTLYIDDGYAGSLQEREVSTLTIQLHEDGRFKYVSNEYADMIQS